jgi:hypothetical protein
MQPSHTRIQNSATLHYIALSRTDMQLKESKGNPTTYSRCSTGYVWIWVQEICWSCHVFEWNICTMSINNKFTTFICSRTNKYLFFPCIFYYVVSWFLGMICFCWNEITLVCHYFELEVWIYFTNFFSFIQLILWYCIWYPIILIICCTSFSLEIRCC